MLSSTADLIHAQHLSTAKQLNGIQESMLGQIAAGQAIDLTDEEQKLLQDNPLQSQAILDRVHDAEQHKMMRDYVVKTADDLSITPQDFSEFLSNVDGGMTEDQAWAEQAHTHGFLSTADYEQYRQAMAKLHLTPGYFIAEDYDTFDESEVAPMLKDVMDDQRQFATKTVLMHQKAVDAGFENIDEYLHATDPSYEFARDTSELGSAHALGMNVDEYIQFLTEIRDVPSTDAEYMRDYVGYSYKYGKTQVDHTQFKDEEALINKASVDWTQAAEKHAFDRMMGSYVSGGDLIHEDTMPMEFFDTHPDDLGKKSLAT